MPASIITCERMKFVNHKDSDVAEKSGVVYFLRNEQKF